MLAIQPLFRSRSRNVDFPFFFSNKRNIVTRNSCSRHWLAVFRSPHDFLGILKTQFIIYGLTPSTLRHLLLHSEQTPLPPPVSLQCTNNEGKPSLLLTELPPSLEARAHKLSSNFCEFLSNKAVIQIYTAFHRSVFPPKITVSGIYDARI